MLRERRAGHAAGRAGGLAHAASPSSKATTPGCRPHSGPAGGGAAGLVPRAALPAGRAGSGSRRRASPASASPNCARWPANCRRPRRACWAMPARCTCGWRATRSTAAAAARRPRSDARRPHARCARPARKRDFPRIDPAIIVLVHDGEHALLGRQASWPPNRYSTIAGFVEPGEIAGGCRAPRGGRGNRRQRTTPLPITPRSPGRSRPR